MEFHSFIFPSRTILSLPTNSNPEKSVVSSGSSHYLNAVDVWNHLLTLTTGPNTTTTPSKIDKNLAAKLGMPGELTYFNGTSFDLTLTVPRIGEGSCYRVDKSVLYQNSVAVAIKRLKIFPRYNGAPDNPASIHESISTILKEVHILTHRPLQYHPNIAALLGYTSEVVSDSDGGPPRVEVSLVAEFAPHGTLQDFLIKRSGQVGFLTKSRLMHDVASGLEALHTCGIAQGDVKLENTLVFDSADAHEGVIAKLSDFGHALIGSGTVSGRYLGTTLLNAPEVRDKTGVIECKAFFACDVFSFGLLIWEVLLDGERFLSKMEIGKEYGGDRVKWLDSLPKDDLLRMSLKTLHEIKINANEKGVVLLLSRVLEATLRDKSAQRKTMKEVLDIFREQMIFREDSRSRSGGNDVAILADVLPLQPHATKKWSLEGSQNTTVHFPEAIKMDILSQLESYAVIDDRATPHLRRSAFYDLAMGHFTGLGMTEVNTEKALSLMLDAAVLGSYKANLVSFRLHEALLGKVPMALLESNHPIVVMEKELRLLSPDEYFPERLRRLENIYQQQIMEQRFDIYNDAKLLETGVFLDDVHDLLQEYQGVELDSLRCVSKSEELDNEMFIVNDLLLHTAARFGVLPLVEFLISQVGSVKDVNITSQDGFTPLVAAARGGQLEIVKFLLGKDARLFCHDMNPLHFLTMFTPSEVESVLELFGSRPDVTECLNYIGEIRIEPFLYVIGTPLEFAISVNNISLVKLLLPAPDEIKEKKRVPGWTGSTLRLAVRSHLQHLVSILIPYEKLFLRNQKCYSEVARFRKAQGKSDLPPFGLFDIAHAPSSLLLALIHGNHLKENVKNTVEIILKEKICAINDQDTDGSTALTRAVRYAPCDINTDIIETLISHGAKFGTNETPTRILHTSLATRNDCSGGRVLQLLLKHNLIPMDTKALAAAVQTTNTRIVKAYLDYDPSRIDVNIGLVEQDISIPLLHVAVMCPGTSSIVRLLLNHGANIDALAEKRTALEIAITPRLADGKTIDELVTRGASLDSEAHLTVVHAAACSKETARVNGSHVLFHLLRHERVRELVNARKYTNEEQSSPLCMAGLNGDIEAVYALLEAGAPVELESVEFMVWMGRSNPEINPMLDFTGKDKHEVIYQWRLRLEKVILLLRDRWDPEHGRSPLHVATELLNYRRVIELVERSSASIGALDRDGKRPLDMLQDVESLKEKGADRSYVDSVIQMKRYLAPVKTHTNDLNGAPDMMTGIENGTAGYGVIFNKTIPSEKSQERLDLEADARQLTLTAQEKRTDIIVRNGRDSPEELEGKYAKTVQEMKESLGETHLETLTAMNKLYEIWEMLGRFQEAENMMNQVLKEREVQLTKKDPDLYGSWSDRVHILCALGRPREAKAYAIHAVKISLENFDFQHQVCLDASLDLALVQSHTGELDKAVGLLENLVDAYKELSMTNRVSYLYVQSTLTSVYLQLGKIELAVNLTKDSANQLESINEDEFLVAVCLVVDDIAGMFDAYLLWEVSEALYLKAVELCLRMRGRRAYCTRIAMHKFAEHYKRRGMWKEAGEVLQQLQVVLSVRFKRSGVETIAGMLELAEAYEMQTRMAEANALLQQAVEILEKNFGEDHLEIVRAKAALGVNWRKQGQLEKAEQIGREAVRGYQRVLGDDEKTMDAEGELAITLAEREHYDEAVALQQKIVETTVRIYGEVHDRTRNSLQGLSTTLMRQCRWDEAEKLIHRQHAIAVEMFGKNSFGEAQTLGVLSTCKILKGESEQAIEILTRVVEMKCHINNGQHTSETLESLCCLAEEQLKLEQWQKSADILRSILSEVSQVYGDGLRDVTIATTSHLAYACEVLGFTDEALKYFNTALQEARMLYGDKHDLTVGCMDDFLRLAPPSSEALKIAQETWTYKRENFGDEDGSTKDTMVILANRLFAARRYLGAERILRKLVENVTDFTPLTLSLLSTLTKVLSAQHKHTTAIKITNIICARKTKDLGESHPDTLSAKAQLADLLIAASDYIAAEAVLLPLTLTETHCDNARRALAHALAGQGRLVEAESLLTGSERDIDCRLLADIFSRTDRHTEAESILKAMPADDAETKAALVRIYERAQRWEEADVPALEVWRETDEGSEEPVHALEALVSLYEKMGDEGIAARVGCVLGRAHGEAEKRNDAEWLLWASDIELERGEVNVSDEVNGDKMEGIRFEEETNTKKQNGGRETGGEGKRKRALHSE